MQRHHTTASGHQTPDPSGHQGPLLFLNGRCCVGRLQAPLSSGAIASSAEGFCHVLLNESLTDKGSTIACTPCPTFMERMPDPIDEGPRCNF